jgi:hypothetical protein
LNTLNAGDAFIGAFDPSFGIHVSDTTYLIGAGIGFATIWILQLKRVISMISVDGNPADMATILLGAIAATVLVSTDTNLIP